MKTYVLVAAIFVTLASFIFHPSLSDADTYQANYVPWSGYWWPLNYGGLVTGNDYRGHPAPLEKYDYVSSGSYSGPAVSFGSYRYSDPNALYWNGLCFNWAAASILEKEPSKDGIYDGVRFRVGDKKGLLTAWYDETLYNRYMISSPVDFQQILEKFIRDQKVPIIFNLGTDGEIWNYPVFMYESSYTRSGNTLHYTTTIYYAADGVFPDFVGTVRLSSTYYYYFTVDDSGRVVGSGWEGASVQGPPVYASEPLGAASLNPGLEEALLRGIINTDDDGYEGNNSFDQAKPLTTGHYPLLALDSDYFKVSLAKGDGLEIALQSEAQGQAVELYGPQLELLVRVDAGSKQSISAVHSGDYFLKIDPPASLDDPGYYLTLQQSMGYQAVFPWTPATGSWWQGIALANPLGLTGRTQVSFIDSSGVPQKACAPGPGFDHYFSTLLDDCFSLKHLTDGYLRVDSDFSIRGLEAVGYGGNTLLGANFISADRASRKVVFPYIAQADGWETLIGLANVGDQKEVVELESYDSAGAVVAWEELEMLPGQRIEDNAYYMSVLPPQARSLSVATSSGRSALLGYVSLANTAPGSGARTLVPLPLDGKSEIVVPHAAFGPDWWTKVALFNSGELTASVTITGYDGSGQQTGEVQRLSLKPRQNWVKTLSSVFASSLWQTITAVKITSTNEQPLQAFVLYGRETGLCMAGCPLSSGDSPTLYVPHVAADDYWWTGLGLMYQGAAPAKVTLNLHDQLGTIVKSKSYTMAPNAHFAAMVKQLFGAGNIQRGRYVSISAASGSLAGIYLIGSNDGYTLMGDALTP